jgi:hypothetical protein
LNESKNEHEENNNRRRRGKGKGEERENENEKERQRQHDCNTRTRAGTKEIVEKKKAQHENKREPKRILLKERTPKLIRRGDRNGTKFGMQTKNRPPSLGMSVIAAE